MTINKKNKHNLYYFYDYSISSLIFENQRKYVLLFILTHINCTLMLLLLYN